jgi:hypothetical protein
VKANLDALQAHIDEVNQQADPSPDYLEVFEALHPTLKKGTKEYHEHKSRIYALCYGHDWDGKARAIRYLDIKIERLSPQARKAARLMVLETFRKTGTVSWSKALQPQPSLIAA